MYIETIITFVFQKLDPLLCVESVPYEGVEMQQSARKKNKFVPLYSLEGREKLVIKLPGDTFETSVSNCVI